MKYLLLIALSLSAYAHEIECPVETPSDAPAVTQLLTNLEEFAASVSQTANAPCKAKFPPTDAEMDVVVAESANTSSNATINGVQFENEDPARVQMFNDFTTERFMLSGNPTKNQKDFQSLYSINPVCKKVKCAMEKIWGAKFAKQLSYLYLKHGYNSSEFSMINGDRLTPSEMNDILIALKDMPTALMPISKGNHPLVRFERGTYSALAGETTVANAVITLFDPWEKRSSNERHYALFHELSHTLSQKSQADRSEAWLTLSGWVKLGKDWRADPSACMVSEYGATNPSEDFAETASAYRYNAQQLKARCPAKYGYMKSVFKGIEYLDRTFCQ